MKIKFKIKDWLKYGKPKPEPKKEDQEEPYEKPFKSVLPEDPKERQAYLLELAEQSERETLERLENSTPIVPAEGKKAISFSDYFDSNL
jgi:hypothetical protein